MRRSWHLLIGFVVALTLVLPAAARAQGTPEATATTGEGQPVVDIIALGAWGSATREFTQSTAALDLAYPILLNVGIAAFPTKDAAAASIPVMREKQQGAPIYSDLKEVATPVFAESQIQLSGTTSIQGRDYTVATLVVQQGRYLVQATAVGYQVDVLPVVQTLVDAMLGKVGQAQARTPEDLAALLPTAKELPGADLAKPVVYDVTEEKTRGASEATPSASPAA